MHSQRVASFFSIALLAAFLTTSHAVEKPNIVVILADDLGYGDVGCYNSESKVPTPNLDKLARNGLRFTDAHSPSTVCTPSRYSLLTGRMCFRTGFRGVFTGVDGPLIEKGRLTIAQMLRDQGYATACVGKWHVGMTFLKADGQPVAARGGGGVDKVRQVDFTKPIKDGPTDVGFDYFFGTVCCPTTDWLYAYIENDRIVETPTELHRPRTTNWLEYEHFRAGLKAPGFDFPQVDLKFLEKSVEFLEGHTRDNPGKPFFLYHATQSAHLPALPAEHFVGKTKAGPLGDFIFEFDYVVGELMKTLDRLKLANNTLVIVTSDNGPEIVITHMREAYGHDSARPWRGMKRDNWEGGHRVPFIASWHGKIKPGTETDETICLTDIMATCVAIVAPDETLPKDAAEDSFSILPVLLGELRDEPVRPYTLHQTISNSLAIRSGPWKLLDHQNSGGNRYDNERMKRYALPNTDPDAPGQLYNLADDPGETKNLFSKHPDTVAELKSRLEQSITSGRSSVANRLRAGAAVADITPKPGVSLDGPISKNGPVVGVHDPLHARALVLDDGATRLAIVVCDACMIGRDVFDSAKAIVNSKTGLATDRMLMAATHTHAAPRANHVGTEKLDDEYHEFLATKIAEAVIQAEKNLAPAAIGWSSFEKPEFIRCRRFLCEPGSVDVNPFGESGERIKSVSGRSSSVIEPAGPVDPQFSILSVRHADGKPLAILGNFSVHYCGGYERGQVSADYFGHYAQAIEQQFNSGDDHPPFVGIMSNGTSGNTGAIEAGGKKHPPFEWMKQSARILADDTVRNLSTTQYVSDVSLAMAETDLKLAVRRPDEKRIAWANQVIANPEGPHPHRWSTVYAQEALHLSKYPASTMVKLQAIRIGKLAIAAMPCEVFAETGLEIKKRSPHKTTFSMELANGYGGYLPTPKQHELGGYETWPARSSFLEVDAEPKILAAVLKLLKDVSKD